MQKVFLVVLLSFFLVFTVPLFVKRVVDGDTFELSNGERVRLIGIDSPEVHDSPKLFYDAKRKGVTKLTIKRQGLRAKQFAEKLVLGKKVRLEFDKNRRDKYGRLLAYVFVDDTVFVNREMIKAGMAEVYRRFSFKHKKAFLGLEETAKKESRGLWKKGYGDE